MQKAIRAATALVGILAAAAWPAMAADMDMNTMKSGAQKGMSKAETVGLDALLNQLHKINVEEIGLGTLAQNQSSNSQVVDYAKRLVSDHQNADDQVSSLAKDKAISLKEAAPKAESKIEEMKNMKGAAFDRMFLTHMVSGHDKAIKLLEGAKGRFTADDKVEKMIDKLLPQLQAHRDEAQKLLPAPAKARKAPRP